MRCTWAERAFRSARLPIILRTKNSPRGSRTRTNAAKRCMPPPISLRATPIFPPWRNISARWNGWGRTRRSSPTSARSRSAARPRPRSRCISPRRRTSRTPAPPPRMPSWARAASCLRANSRLRRSPKSTPKCPRWNLKRSYTAQCAFRTAAGVISPTISTAAPPTAARACRRAAAHTAFRARGKAAGATSNGTGAARM